jgi:large subunit ribosomal protein L13
MKTFIPKVDPANRKWYVIDLKGAILGRSAIKVANTLRGKNKPIFTPHLDTGDHVIAINARGLKVLGKNKPQQLKYYRYSGYPGGLSETTFERLIQKRPEAVFENAVKKDASQESPGTQDVQEVACVL